MVALGSDGRLPPGVHELTLPDVKRMFGTFMSSDRRPRLFEKLEQLVELARRVSFVRYLIINGSFVTSVSEPGDIDLILVIDAAILTAASWSPMEYSLLSSKRIRRNYPFDVLVAPETSQAFAEYLDLFARVKNQPGKTKGVVKLVVRD